MPRAQQRILGGAKVPRAGGSDQPLELDSMGMRSGLQRGSVSKGKELDSIGMGSG